ncbi:hypothetical protein KAJ27_02505 [bacterium]|nr:hypothetical protein [bacterium]
MNLLAFPEIELRPNDSLIDQIERNIEFWLRRKETSKLIFVKGEPGCGKTAFLKSLQQKLLEKGKISFYTNPDPLKDVIEPFNFLIDAIDLGKNGSYNDSNSEHQFLPCLFDIEQLKKWFNLLDLKADDYVFYDQDKKYVIDSYVKCLILTLKKYINNGQIPIMLIDNYDRNQELIYKVTKYFLLQNNISAFNFIFVCVGDEIPEFLSDYSDIQYYEIKKPLKYDYYECFKDKNVIEQIYEVAGGNTAEIFNSIKRLYVQGELVFKNNLFESRSKNFNIKKYSSLLDSLESEILDFKDVEIELLKCCLIFGMKFRVELIASLFSKSVTETKKILNDICAKSYILIKRGVYFSFCNDSVFRFLQDFFHVEKLYSEAIDIIETKYSRKKILSDFTLANFYLYCCIKSGKDYRFIRYSFEVGRKCMEIFGYTKAIYLYRTILELYPKIKLDSNRKKEIIGKTFLDSGRIHYLSGYWKLALDNYTHALKLFNKLDNDKLVFDVTYCLIELYIRMNLIEKCPPLLKKIRNIALNREDNYMLIVFFNLYGEYYYKSRNYSKAKQIFSTIYKDYVHRKNYKSIRKEFNKTLRGLGKLAYWEGDYSTSVEYYESSLKCHFEEQSPYDKVDTYHRLGTSSLKIGNIDRSFIYFAYAFMEISRSEDIFLMNKILISLGIAYMVKGDFKKSEEIIKKSLSIAEFLNNTKGRIIAYQNLAQVNLYKGNERSVKNYVKRALILAKKSDDNFGIASLNQTLGKLYLYKCDYKNASKCFSEALKFSKKYSKHEIYILSLCYYTMSCYYCGFDEEMFKGKEEISNLISELQDNYLINMIYLTMLYYELKKGNISIINVLLRKVEFYLKDYYGGLELVNLYSDLAKIKGLEKEYYIIECRKILENHPNELFLNTIDNMVKN